MATFFDMINYSYPDAVVGKDCTVKTDNDGNLEIDYWNEAKLGPEPDIIKLHASYMKSVKRRKQMIPTQDDSDPAPWLNASKEKKTPETVMRVFQDHNIKTDIPIVRIETN